MERNRQSVQAAPALPQAAIAQANSWTALNTEDDDLTQPEMEPEWKYNELSDAKCASYRFTRTRSRGQGLLCMYWRDQ